MFSPASVGVMIHHYQSNGGASFATKQSRLHFGSVFASVASFPRNDEPNRSSSVNAVFSVATIFSATLEILPQVQPLVQRRHLIGVTIEHQRAAAREFADAPLARLRPARMRYLWIDVRVKAIFIGRRCHPE